MYSTLPYKSVAVALLFSILFGPVGLLYSSFWGGFILTICGLFILSTQNLFPLLYLWLLCCVWSVGAVEAYNHRVAKTSRETRETNETNETIEVT